MKKETMKSDSLKKKVGVICSQFPEMHETFVIRELRALKDGGIPLVIYSMKFCRDRIIHPESEALKPVTVTMAWNDVKTWERFLPGLRSNPRTAMRLLGWTLRRHANSPSNFMKAFIVWAQAIAMSGRMREDGITHLHAHWATMPSTAAYILSEFLGIPFSLTAHAWDIFVANPSLKEKLLAASAVITCTDYNRARLEQICPEAHGKILLNYHGVNTEKFSPEAMAVHASVPDSSGEPRPWRMGEPVKTFLSIGRFVEQKGYGDLITAYARLAASGRDFKAVIVGEGPLRKKIMSMAENAGLGGRILFRESMSQQELLGLYRHAYAFVLPCVVAANGDRDGIPNVILEAMAAGLPVVSTQVSGVPEAVQDQRTGLCVAPHDPVQLAEALDFLLRNEVFAEEAGARARQYAREKFDGRTHMNQLVATMRRIAGLPAPETARPGVVFSAARRIKVAQFIWSLEMGGAERVASAIALGLDRSRFEPIVICMNHEGVLAAGLKAAGVPVFALNKKPGLDFGMLKRLVRLLKEEKVEILHAHLFGAGFWARLAGPRAGVRKVYVHEHGMQPWRGGYHFFIDKLLARQTEKVLFVSRQVMETYLAKTGISPARCALVPNGVEIYEAEPGEREMLRRKFGWTDAEKWILSIGRLSAEKGHADLVQAFSDVLRICPEARLVIVGSGPEDGRLRELCTKLGCEAKVLFAGLQKDIRPWLVSADLYVQPSLREGMSLAVLEAMGASLPVIATTTGDAAKLIRDGENGFLAEPGKPSELAKKILEVLKGVAGPAPLGQNARDAVVRDFSLAHMIRTVESLYSEFGKIDPGQPGTGFRQAAQEKAATYSQSKP